MFLNYYDYCSVYDEPQKEREQKYATEMLALK